MNLTRNELDRCMRAIDWMSSQPAGVDLKQVNVYTPYKYGTRRIIGVIKANERGEWCLEVE